MSGPPVPDPGHCAGEVCITCSDVAVPVRIVSLHGFELATVRTEAGTDEEVSVALVDADVGDIVLVHAKEAIALIGVPSGEPWSERVAGVQRGDRP